MNSIADRWTQFQGHLEDLCDELGREKPVVIAVSKTRSYEEVQEAIDLGIHDFGENYPSYFREKAEKFPNQNWHFIGTLQRNKAEQVCDHASMIHTVDRKKLVNRLNFFNYSGPCLIQVNISGEKSKSGVDYDVKKVRELTNYCKETKLSIQGLMTIGNFNWDSATNEIEFRKFIDFGKKLGFENFSLGMSGDWREAVRAGSTHLRIGTTIFGQRQN